MTILKFGGTSVADAMCIAQVKSIVERSPAAKCIVVSAMSGVTDMLLTAYKRAIAGTPFTEITENILQRHLHAARILIPQPQRDEVSLCIKLLSDKLTTCLLSATQERVFSTKTQDYVLSFGERMNSCLISQTISDTTLVDARTIIKTNSNFGKALVDTTETYRRCAALKNSPHRIVVAGFIASNENGDTTTLGRGGSDYTAAIVAAATMADSVEIWTDTDGFMTADPRRIADARTIPQMSYAEVFELARYGAKVVYPPTVYPLLCGKIPMYIKNTFNPECAGTLVCSGVSASMSAVCSVSAMENAAVVSLKIKENEDCSSIVELLKSVLAERQIEVIHIAYSPHYAWLAVNTMDVDSTKNIVAEKFSSTIGIDSIEERAIVAAVGENLRDNKNILKKIVALLKENNLATREIVQTGISIPILAARDSMNNITALLHREFIVGTNNSLR